LSAVVDAPERKATTPDGGGEQSDTMSITARRPARLDASERARVDRVVRVTRWSIVIVSIALVVIVALVLAGLDKPMPF
jgi:hypothetical protein